jgi:hypothetical protein
MSHAKQIVNIGKLHRVKCEWCGLKMPCNCFQGNGPDGEHMLILCLKCQVTEFLNLLFGKTA